MINIFSLRDPNRWLGFAFLRMAFDDKRPLCRNTLD
jgi:hypothetical protein